jgi:ankyrin repeat protein
MLVCKYAVDACCAILLVKAQFTTANPGDDSTKTNNVVVVPNKQAIVSDVLHVDTQKSALCVLLRMVSNAADGLYAMLEGIAEAGFGSSKHPNASIVALQNFFIDKLSVPSDGADPAADATEDLASGMEGLRIEGRSPNKRNTASGYAAVIGEDFTWSRSQFFDQLFETTAVSAAPFTSLDKLAKNKIMWPYVALTAALIATISNPAEPDVATTSLAIAALTESTRAYTHDENSQPLCCDAISAVFIALGGCVGLVGCVGSFGKFATCPNYQYFDLIQYLVGRGNVREQYWRTYVANEAAKVEIDPKTGKPIVSKDKKDKSKDKAKEKAANDKKKGKDANTGVSCVLEVVYNDDAVVDEASFDPNHGPDSAFFKQLLQIQVDEFHSNTPFSSVLVAATQGLISSDSALRANDVVTSMLGAGANSNAVDGNGVSSLMYGVLLHSHRFVDAGSEPNLVSILLENKADVDAVDRAGNPVIKYAAMALSSTDVTEKLCLQGHVPVFFGRGGDCRKSYDLLGYPSLPVLRQLLKLGADVHVCDRDGNGPLHWFIGVGQLQVCVGGSTCSLKNAAFNSMHVAPARNRDQQAPLCDDNADVQTAISLFPLLIESGADIDFCNRLGIVPLHIAAGRGSEALIDVIFMHGPDCTRNCLDSLGFSPLHYAAAACPRNAEQVISKLLMYSENQPAVRMTFKDDRSTLSKSDKGSLDFSLSIDKILQDVLAPTCLSAKRASKTDLLRLKVDMGTNILQLAMCAHSMITVSNRGGQDEGIGSRFENIFPVVSVNGNNKDDRLRLCLFLIGQLVQDPLQLQQHLLRLLPFDPVTCNNPLLVEAFTNTDENGMTVLHSLSKLLTNGSPERELSAAEKRSKRVKSYGNVELQLLDMLFTFHPAIDVNAVCRLPVDHSADNEDYADRELRAPGPWTSLLGAISSRNRELIQFLQAKGATLDSGSRFLHVLAATKHVTTELAEFLVNTLAQHEDFHAHINGVWGNQCREKLSARPIHIAVRASNLAVLQALLRCPKCDINAKDSLSGMTPFHEACAMANLPVLQTFADHASDRVDFLVKSETADPCTCVEEVIQSLNVPMMTILISMRRNDVVEAILSTGNSSGISLLEAMERENMRLAAVCRFSETRAQAPGEDQSAASATADLAIGGDEDLTQHVDRLSLDDSGTFGGTDFTQAPPGDPGLATAVAKPTVVAGPTVRKLALAKVAPVSDKDIDALRAHDCMLVVLLKAVRESGFVGDDVHVHRCFGEGLAYSEFCGGV